MPNITLSVSEELKRDMDSMKDVNWSEVTRELLAEKVRRLKVLRRLDDMLKDSKLSDKDALELGRKASEGMHRQLKKQGLV